MHNAFDRSSRRVISERRLKKSKGEKLFIPVSYGVRHGYIKDPGFPHLDLAEEFPFQRRFPRIPARFQVRINGGTALPVAGNVSEGGAMFVLKLAAHRQQVELVAKVAGAEYRAPVEVIRTRPTKTGIAHHVRFADLTMAAPVWRAIAARSALPAPG